uniref:Uncharacterized protein n=1 Tax=Anguilla anguilla TaxID=7936 RepID=A0A0E9SDA7_ANGAN
MHTQPWGKHASPWQAITMNMLYNKLHSLQPSIPL